MTILVKTKERGLEYIQDVPPVNPIAGLTWEDTSSNPSIHKVFTGSVWKEIFQPIIQLTSDFITDDDTVVINQTVSFTDTSHTNKDIVSWAWDFGDGSTSDIQNPSHQYTSTGQYDVELTVTDIDTDTDTKLVTNFITVANDPGASFSTSTPNVHTGDIISFTDQSTSNGTITNWFWDFGDGSDSAVQNPYHQYLISGTYTVVLIITDEFGSDTLTRTDYVNIDIPPVAQYTSDLISCLTNTNITFTDQSTTLGTITTWAWDFGDSSQSTLQHPVHQYASPGTYTVELTVTDEFGNNTITKTDYITVSILSGPGSDYGFSIGGKGDHYQQSID